MLSKLVLIFVVVAVCVYGYMTYLQPVEINAPAQVASNSFFTVTSSKPGDWLVEGARTFQVVGNDVVVLSGTDDIKIIYSPGLITKVIKVTDTVVDPVILDEFTKLVQEWAPARGRLLVATALEALANGYDGEDINEFLQLTKINNHVALGVNVQWNEFFKNLSEYCEANMSEKDLEQHKQLWLRIAEALRNDKQ